MKCSMAGYRMRLPLSSRKNSRVWCTDDVSWGVWWWWPKITDGCLRAIEAGAEIVFCTGGMSVDPDDKTPLAIKIQARGSCRTVHRCCREPCFAVVLWCRWQAGADMWTAWLRHVQQAHDIWYCIAEAYGVWYDFGRWACQTWRRRSLPELWCLHVS